MSEADPFSQFKDVFFAECSELTSDMEQHLSELQAGDADLEDLNAIFRAVHSIKAGAGAFHYTELVDYSHVFEALLDKLRAGEISIYEDVTQVLFRASDILADLIDAAQNEDQLEAGYGREVKAEMEKLLNATGAVAVPAEDVFPAPEPEQEAVRQAATYLIRFEPHAEVFRHANEPILILRELKTLGDLEVNIDMSRLPDIHTLEPEDSYFSWSLKLTTEASREDIDEVFEFVEDDCKLEIMLAEEEPENPASTEVLPAQEVAEGDPAPASGGSPAKTKNKSASIRVDLDRVDKVVNMVGELVITQAMLSQELEQLDPSRNMRLMAGMEELASHARELQENVMAIRMQPVKSVFSRMPRLVRDLSSKLDKKVRLVMTGENTEVDKTVIEEIADPLTHMIRNSLDHGIGTPEERERAGKNPEGTIHLAAEHRGGRIIIEVSDDGRGINRERVLQKAQEKGLLDGDELSDEEIDNLIFHPGFSTAETVTDVSGRGVGMDVVRKNIMSLGGRISVQSEQGKGSKFTLSLPLTLAVLDGMIVGVGAQKFVVPVNSIIESIRPAASDVMTLFGDTQVVRIRGEYIPLLQVSGLFGVSGGFRDPSQALVVIVELDGGNHVGLVVDELLGQQQVVIKSLETNYTHVEGISAATILGNGQVCLILDIDGLEEMERCRRGGRSLNATDIEQMVEEDQRHSA
ncbi:chemotaxis protein CheA [Emcibacter nanhaiensis]|uniref:Chemotaxis protein CheA n=1 Tax=Emcibacter nanhaiensis TaxID=1505037 RepID=A0A501PDC4_9PROT|nr:chemotaxis protein CheA [Emcibacter nanhaiensis]TPD57904.1 chemotaxis protein CheA [Emcibacter nanhaiensis]